MKIAAIDAGSNGLRMIVGEADETWRVKILENIRLPVRLGQPFIKSRKLFCDSGESLIIMVYKKCAPLLQAPHEKLKIGMYSLIVFLG
jgi:exopolyphosphatase/pppGpp-phosphohydrolase